MLDPFREALKQRFVNLKSVDSRLEALPKPLSLFKDPCGLPRSPGLRGEPGAGAWGSERMRRQANRWLGRSCD